MNAADDPRFDPIESIDLIRRLPGISDADLPFHGKHRIKEHLMRETAWEAYPAPARSRRRLILLAAVGAATCAAILAVTLGVSGSNEHLAVAQTEPAAVQLLDRAALAAQAAPAPTVRDGQFLYTKTAGHSTSLSETANGGMAAAATDESAERWVSVDGSDGTVTRTARGTSTDPAGGKGKANINGPTYRFLEGLSTDPDRLLETIYADARLNHGEGSGSTTGPDQEAFVAIGDLLRTVEAPPGVSAALYRAAARIPGVVLVPQATDAIGRPGVAVARVHNGERTEWIFDTVSMRLLGERTVLLKDSAWGKAGAPVTSVAIVARGVVDKAGQVPGQ
ncbi:CU044_5270 family protein [Streptomyces sp. NBC_00536]|uniref:CU044_5270 family protein n=1 Tax=Streptomyces sp. NBC_00536 TaxID=2975769 RepID=UPI002E804E1C|nr:CU044_5270 family protein [Streptomyces sp. NBC_00536]WUC79628.1 CU044_5270 family protein [Streptomyces sp. NBC_00536]